MEGGSPRVCWAVWKQSAGLAMRDHGSFKELRTAILRWVTYSTFRQERAVTELEVNLESDKVHQENRIGQNRTE